MRLRQRLGTAARDAAELARERVGDRLSRGEEADRPPGDAPGSRPRAAYAGILDGRHLWLAVDATPGTLALRDTGSGSVLPLTSDLVEDDPRYRSVRSDLASVPGGGAAAFEVVITAPGGKVHRIWTPPLPRLDPMRVPEAGAASWQLTRTDDGTLGLRREAAPPGATLLSIASDAEDTVTLHLAGVADGAVLRLVEDDTGDETTLGPVSGGVATVTPAEVPEGIGRSFAVHAGDLLVRRRASDLGRPDNAVMLPQVQNDEADESEDAPMFSMVYRWLPDGVLRIRRPQGRAQGRPA